MMKTLRLVVITLVAFVPSLGLTDDTLATFKGGIGVDPVSNAPGPGAVANSVTRNIVRGVQPASSWRIADLTAEVKVDGHIRVNGRGLVFASGDTIGTALVVTPAGGTVANINVFATLICENAAPFVERNTGPVPLAANGDFRIDDVLSPRPSASCNTPVLLIRNEANRVWFAAGIQKFGQKNDDDD